MQITQMIDIVIGVSFFIAMAVGYHKGLVRTIAGIAAMVASYVGAALFAVAGREPLARMVLMPVVQKQLSGNLPGMLAEEALAKAAEGMAYSVLFFVAFTVFSFVLFRMVKMLKLIDDIPVVGKINKLGGAVLGFLWVFLLCLLIGHVFFTYVPDQLQKQWGFTPKAVHQTVLLDVFVPEKDGDK